MDDHPGKTVGGASKIYIASTALVVCHSATEVTLQIWIFTSLSPLFFVCILGGMQAWTHIRKGKKATGYNYEMALTWVGIVSGRDMSEQVHGSLDYELTVDDDEPDTVFKCAQNHIPFVPQVKTCLLRYVLLPLFVSCGHPKCCPELERHVPLSR